MVMEGTYAGDVGSSILLPPTKWLHVATYISMNIDLAASSFLKQLAS